MRPAYVTFLKTSYKYQNVITSGIYRTHYIYKIINPDTCQSQITLPISIWDTLYVGETSENWLIKALQWREFFLLIRIKGRSHRYFCRLETVQDFLIELDIKPLMHLLQISIFSLNNDILRLTKIMNNLFKDCKIRTFKVIFQCLKLVESFQKKHFLKKIWSEDQLILVKCFENFDFESTLFTKNVPNFCRLCS